MPNNDGCEKCPYINQEKFEEYKAECEGLRIRLDKQIYRIGENLRVMCIVGEIGVFACGSEVSEEKNLPTIPHQDYLDTKLLVPHLKKLHDHGLLPEQIL